MPPVPADPDAPVGAPLYPPREWFAKPDWLAPGRKITVVTDGPEAGRVAGYVAPNGQCILSGNERRECWTVPDSPSSYAAAMQGETLTAEGDEIPTANIGGNVDHANPMRASFDEARDHYANTASQVMRVVYGQDEYGVWAAGALWPEVTHRQAAVVRASALSGDWRWRQEMGAYDMAGSQLVNVPGFPLIPKVVAYAASASDPHPALIGGWGGSPLEEPDMGKQTVILDDDQMARLAAMLAEPVAAHTAACACGGTGQVAAPPAQAPTQTPPKPVDVPAPNAGGVSRDEFDALVARVEQVEATIMDDQLSDVDAMAAAASLPEPATAAS